MSRSGIDRTGPATPSQGTPYLCPESHVTDPMHVFCPSCGAFMVLSGLPMSGRRMTRWPVGILAVSYLVAIVLLRRPGMTWPAYVFAAVTFLNVFAMAISKGAVVRQVSLVTAVVTVYWAFGLEALFIPFTGPPRWGLGPVAVWGLLLVYGYILGSSVPQALDGTWQPRSFSTLFLMMAAFVFGMWAVVGVYAEYGMGFRWVQDLIVLAVTLVPLGLMALVVGFRVADGAGGWVTVTSAVLVAASSYLTLLHVLLSGLADVRHELPWQIQGVAVLSGNLPWLSLLSWKFVVTSLLAAAAFVVMLVSSIERVWKENTTRNSDYLLAEIERAKQQQGAANDGMPLDGKQIGIVAMQVTRLVYLVADFGARVLLATIASAYRAIRQAMLGFWTLARMLGLPLVAFSAASLLTISVLHDVTRYGAGTGVGYGGPSLWAGLAVTAAIVLVLGSASFALFPEVTQDGDHHDQAWLWAVIGPTAIIAWALASLVTLATVPLWVVDFALQRVGIHAREFGYGPLLLTGLVAVLAFFILATMPTLLAITQGKSPSQAAKATAISARVTLLLAAVLAVALGWGPVLHWIANAK